MKLQSSFWETIPRVRLCILLLDLPIRTVFPSSLVAPGDKYVVLARQSTGSS